MLVCLRITIVNVCVFVFGWLISAVLLDYFKWIKSENNYNIRYRQHRYGFYIEYYTEMFMCMFMVHVAVHWHCMHRLLHCV